MQKIGMLLFSVFLYSDQCYDLQIKSKYYTHKSETANSAVNADRFRMISDQYKKHYKQCIKLSQKHKRYKSSRPNNIDN